MDNVDGRLEHSRTLTVIQSVNQQESVTVEIQINVKQMSYTTNLPFNDNIAGHSTVYVPFTPFALNNEDTFECCSNGWLAIKEKLNSVQNHRGE